MTSARAVTIARLAGFFAVLGYLVLALIAYAFFPQTFNPVHNWLSDLGNTLVNPSGAVFYDAGCIVAGLLLAVLYVGLNQWRNGDRVSGILLTIGQAAGFIASLALILSAIFNIGQAPLLHSRFSLVLTVGLTWFLAFANTAFLRHPSFRTGVAVYGFVTSAACLIYGVFFNRPLGEWVALGMFIVYVLLLVATMGRLKPEDSAPTAGKPTGTRRG